MYFPTTRVLTVLELLQSHQQLSGPDIAERLEVNPRTVRRYITMLQDLGIPVEAERGRYGTYRLRPGYKLPPLMFSEEEALALTLGLLAARKLGLAVAAPAVEGALAKIERVLPSALRIRVQAVYETLVFDFTPPAVAPSSEVVGTLCAAVQQRQQVRLRYQAWEGEATERNVDLYGLVYRAGFWYAVGYCHLRTDLRVFRLDRILQAEIGPDTYTLPSDFDCLAYVTRSIAMTPAHWLVDVLLETTLEDAQQMVPLALATLEQASNGVVLRCYVNNLDWIAHLLAGLNCHVVVRQPTELRAALQRLAQKITEMADSTD
ncbi:MAG: YafY family transcriptional regulator [Chloroflexota bacterium]|nr:YafY family transcriptional regulator [Chloroflexota bacterium]